jgi:hypothetical protein
MNPQNPLPWMNASSSSTNSTIIGLNNDSYSRNNNAEALQRMAPSHLASRNIYGENEIDEDVAIHLDNPNFVDMNSVMNERTEGAPSSHFPPHQQIHVQQRDPPGLKSYGNKIFISNSKNKKLYILIGIVLIFLILELTVFRHKATKEINAKIKTETQDQTNKNDDNYLLHRFVPDNIDVTSEIMSVFWSLIVIVTIGSFIQTWEIEFDQMTGNVKWTAYRSFVMMSRRKFSITAVRRVVGKIQLAGTGSTTKTNNNNNSNKKPSSSGINDSSSSSSLSAQTHQDNLGYSSLNKQSFSIELVVVAMKEPSGFPPQDLVVQNVVGFHEAREILKCWVGFFQRMGANCEEGPVSRSANENKTEHV